MSPSTRARWDPGADWTTAVAAEAIAAGESIGDRGQQRSRSAGGSNDRHRSNSRLAEQQRSVSSVSGASYLVLDVLYRSGVPTLGVPQRTEQQRLANTRFGESNIDRHGSNSDRREQQRSAGATAVDRSNSDRREQQRSIRQHQTYATGTSALPTTGPTEVTIRATATGERKIRRATSIGGATAGGRRSNSGRHASNSRREQLRTGVTARAGARFGGSNSGRRSNNGRRGSSRREQQRSAGAAAGGRATSSNSGRRGSNSSRREQQRSAGATAAGGSKIRREQHPAGRSNRGRSNNGRCGSNSGRESGRRATAVGTNVQQSKRAWRARRSRARQVRLLGELAARRTPPGGVARREQHVLPSAEARTSR